MPVPKAALQVGELVAQNYEISGLAGAGGMGVVYKARDRKLGRTVALKFLPPELGHTELTKARFLREAQIASTLDHPNIGVIHGIEETAEGRSFIVMAFYDGQSLADRLAGGPLPVVEVLEIALQMARGLAEAHAHEFVHRDVKPSNVMLTGSGLVKIVDFGLARVAEQTATLTHGTTGTASYMSPEQSLGKPVDQRTDIWALGVVMAEALTGRNPFLRENLPATAMAILNDPPGELTGVPLEVQKIIYRALSKDPVKRYQTCTEMLRDTEAAKAVVSASGAGGTVSRKGDRDALKAVREEASKSAWMPRTPQTKSRSRWMALIAVVILVAMALLVPAVRGRFRAAMFGPKQKHIAVLPFDNIGNNPQNEALVQGLMDSLSGKLSNLDVANQSLWVIPSSEVRRLQVSDPAAALRTLGANLVVKGSVARDGQDVRLNVSLIDTKNMRQMGSAELDDAAGDLASLQNDAVSRLARLMNINVSADMLRATGGSVNPAAYEGYLSALGYMQRYDKPGNLDAAIQALQNAVRDDSRFALGYAQLAEAYRLKNRVDQDPKWLAEALANAKKAVELDDNIPVAHVTLARIHRMMGHDDLVLQEYQRALSINPKDGSALNGLAHAYEASGRVADAEKEYQTSAALQRESWEAYSELGNFYDRQGKFQLAIDQYRHALALTPDNSQVYLNMGATYLDWGDPKVQGEAEKALKKSIEISPSYPAYANLGNLYLGQHRYVDSAAATEKALELNANDYQVWNNLNLVYTWLKQEDKAANARERMSLLLEQQVKLKPKDALTQAFIGLLNAHKQLADKATSRIQTALALAPEDGNVLALAAQTYEVLGDRKKALVYLSEAMAKGYSIEQVKIDPDMQGILADPQFKGQK